jgi:hypothetical protein
MASPGTHLRVRRQFIGVPYWHHGILVDDSEVIDFGGWDQTKIRRLSLASFDPDHSVEEVSHPIKWSGITYSPLLPPEQVIDRAEWLLDHQPPSYQLGYRNCESIALWCATGDYESFQVKQFMYGQIPVSMVIVVLLAKKPSIGKPLAYISIAATALTAVPYQHSRAFFNHTRKYPGIGKWGLSSPQR